ncbi:MAG: glycosyl hydrolase [Terriglobales bacterium]
MKRLIVWVTLLLAASMAEAQISPQFFGMHTGSWNPWPSQVDVQFASWRSNASVVKWSDINTAPGVYDWTRLDRMMGFTAANGQSVFYTVYSTPSWASSCPTCSCNAEKHESGACYAPNDLIADGSGTDQHLKDFVTALLQHEGAGKIKYLEVWNEPNITFEFAGTVAQLVRMTKDVRSVANSIDPNILISSPPETGDGPQAADCVQMQYLDQFLAAGGGQYVDIIGLHGYVVNPEDIITRVNNTIAVMQKYGQTGKPIFVTEGSWATANGDMPADLEPGFSFRHYLSMLSTPVQRFYLFSFDAVNLGNLWSDANNALTANGVAYQRYYDWLVGATMTKACQAQSPGSSIWSCDFTKPPNIQAEVIWDTAATWGQTTNLTVPSQYGEYLDLYGNRYPIQNHQAPVGYDPIGLVLQK